MTKSRCAIASAPGKVLICGGYSVLRGGTAVVYSTNARLYSSVDLIESNIISNAENTCEILINVCSPQLDKLWKYKVTMLWDSSDWIHAKDFDNLKIGFSQLKNYENLQPENNKYIYYAIIYAFAALIFDWKKTELELLYEHKIQIITKAHNSFYSHSKTFKRLDIVPNRNASSFLPDCLFVGSKFVKTGLGSSAALTTSLVTSILCWGFKWTNLDNESQLNLIHNVSQLAHFQAQGKVGSGFDIASGVYGSLKYYKHSNLEFQHAIDMFSKLFLKEQLMFSTSTDWLNLMQSVLHAKWINPLTKKISLPPKLLLVLGETSRDAHTPNFVRSVLGWAEKNEELSAELFDRLDGNNKLMSKLLDQLHSYYKKDQTNYVLLLETISRADRSKWSSVISEQHAENAFAVNLYNCIEQIQIANQSIRRLMREIGKHSNVPIEPEELTQILNLTQNLNGVLFCGTPGAGGFDAIFAIVLSEENRNCTENFWLSLNPPIYSVPIEEHQVGVTLEKFEFS